MTPVAKISTGAEHAPQREPAWTSEQFERLNEDEATAVLLHRMRTLTRRGLDPQDALVWAAKLDVPLD